MDFLNTKNKDKKLVLACKVGNVEKIKKYLGPRRSNTNINYQSKKSGDTPLHKAIKFGNIDHINMLLAESGIAVNAQNNMEESPIFIVLNKQGPDVIPVTEALVKAGASIRLPNKVQQMPLHIAAKHGNTELIRLFLEKGAEIDSADKDDITALHMACEGGFADSVEALLAANALITRNKAGLTPIQVASAKGAHNVLAVFDRYASSPAAAVPTD